MASISKRASGTWQNTSYGIRATATDTITTLPTTIYSDGTNATVSIKGNTTQNGTPTPDNPIMPQGTGERTGNLWNNLGFSAGTISTAGVHSLSNTYGTSLSTVSGGSVDITQVASGGTTAYQNGYFFIEIDISQFSLGDDIVISFDYEITNKLSSTSTTVAYVGQGATDTNVIANWGENGRAIIKATITSAMTRPYVEIRLCGNSIKVRNVQINTGSTALPYEPYGYKIPISSAGQTTPVYLGEVQTTRSVVKYAFTGQENWQTASGFFYLGSISPDYLRARDTITYVCTHYTVYPQTGFGINIPNKNIALGSDVSNQRVYVKDDDMADVTAFKTYLQQQYSAGTPVTVWYVLATEETAVVNEPLMKIDGYADEVNNISIPTTDGANTLSVGTTVQPSEVSANYHGWHMGTVHERVSGQWD